MCVRSHKYVCGKNVCVSGGKGRGRDVEEKSATVDHHIIKKRAIAPIRSLSAYR